MARLSWTEDYGEELFENLNMSLLNRDMAYVKVTNTFGSICYLYTVLKECYKCPYIEDVTISKNQTYFMSTTFEKLMRVMVTNPPMSSRYSQDGVFCEFEPGLGEFGVYSLEVSKHGCSFHTLKEPVNIYFPAITVLLLLASIFALFKLATYFWNCFVKSTESAKSIEIFKEDNRLKSLDTFRGICVAAMIFINCGSGGYVALNHTTWNGLHFGDLINPSFLWIMGVCISIGVSSAKANTLQRKGTLRTILKRSCILALLGFIKNAISSKRRGFSGVLTKSGICYFVTALITSKYSDRLDKSFALKSKSSKFIDISAIKYHWMVAVVLVIVHTSLTLFFKVPNCPRGYLGPGGYHDDRQHQGCTGGVNGYIDNITLVNNVYYTYPQSVYNAGPVNAYGTLGFLTSIALVVIGIQGGAIIVFHKTHSQRIIRWLAWGFLLLFLGGMLCSFSKEDGLIPINFYHWSLSFVCVTTGFAFITFTFCYYLVDVKKCWTGKPFIFAGMNSIICFMGHTTAPHMFPFRWALNGELVKSTHFLTVLENIWVVTFWIFITYCLFKINWFLRI